MDIKYEFLHELSLEDISVFIVEIRIRTRVGLVNLRSENVVARALVFCDSALHFVEVGVPVSDAGLEKLEFFSSFLLKVELHHGISAEPCPSQVEVFALNHVSDSRISPRDCDVGR